MNGDLKTDEKDFRKWRQHAFKARKKKAHSRQSKEQEELRNRGLKQNEVLPEEEAQSDKDLE